MIDKLNTNVYNWSSSKFNGVHIMTISEQIRVLCTRTNISTAELARRLGQSPQSFSAKLKRETFTILDLEKIADAAGVKFERNFILFSGEKI